VTADPGKSKRSKADLPAPEQPSLVRLQDFVGNNVLVDLLRRVALPPASLFRGAEGVGKTTLSLSLAALENCRKSGSGDFCGECESCIKIASGNHPDVILFQPGGASISIDAMRRLSREAQFHPFQGNIRVFIVDRAEQMTQEAANSILKTLEEPPPTSHIILTTCFPELLLPTIRSRCQSFLFRGLSREELKVYLESHCGPDDAEYRAAFANGSVGTALSLDLSRTQGDRDRMLDLLSNWEDRRSFATLYQVCEAEPMRSELKQRERVIHYLDLLRLLAEDLYFIAVETEERIINHDRLHQLRPLSGRLQLDWIRNFIYHIGEARSDVGKNVNPLICFETLWLRKTNRQGA